MVRASHPTGTREDDILSLKIATNLGKRDSESYDTRSYRHSRWKNQVADKGLSLHPKVSDDETVASVALSDLLNYPNYVAREDENAAPN